MKTRKSGIIAVTAAAVFMAALFLTNCVAPVDPTRAPAAERVPARMAYMRLNVRQIMPLTILPGTPDLEELYFQVEIWDGTNQIDLDDPFEGDYDLLTDEGHPVPIGDGLRVVVRAFTDPAFTYIIGEGEDDDVDITLAGGTATVVLTGIDWEHDDAGDGYFHWNVTVPSVNVASASLNLVRLLPAPAGTTPTGFPVTLTPGANAGGGPVAVPAGIYRIEVTVVGAAGYRNRVVSRIVHIYTGNYSAFTANQQIGGGAIVIPDLNEIVEHTVTLHGVAVEDTGPGDYIQGTDTVDAEHGLTLAVSHPALATPVHSAGPTVYFEGWYRNSGFTTPFAFATTRVLRPLELWARWDLNNVGDLNIILSWQGVQDEDASTNVGIITWDLSDWGFSGPDTPITTVNVSNASAFVPASIRWYLNTVPLNGLTMAVTSATDPYFTLEPIVDAAGVLTLDFTYIEDIIRTPSGHPFYALAEPGTHIITVEAERTTDGQIFSAQLILNAVP